MNKRHILSNSVKPKASLTGFFPGSAGCEPSMKYWVALSSYPVSLQTLHHERKLYRQMLDCQLSLISPLRVTGVAISARNTMRSLSNDDGDGNENVKKAIGLLRTITTLHLYNAFSYFSLPSLHDYDARIPDFTLYGGHK